MERATSASGSAAASARCRARSTASVTTVDSPVWTAERWAAVADSATTVATAGGVNRTTLPSVTSSPAAAASRMS
jgi:hypothetical protein